MIPRIIHQVWFKFGNGPTTPPAEYDAMRTSWREKHPDWEFIQWDLPKARAFLRQYYPQHLELFDGYKRDIHRCDAIRYYFLEKLGGFYVDTDVTCLNSIEDLRRHKIVLAVDKYTKHINNNHFMGAVPGTDFFKSCIERLSVASMLQMSKDSFMATMSVAGPFFLTSAASNRKRRNEIKTLSLEEEARFLTHHEKHSWKMNKSIIGDIIRFGLVATGVVATGLLVKKVVDDGRELR